MLYKLINEYQIEPFVGKILRANGKIYANPSENTLKQNGYKELIVAEKEEREGFYIIVTYTEDENAIYEYIEYHDVTELNQA